MISSINYSRPKLFPYQTAIIDSPARFTATQASTKVGKSASHLVWLFEEALKCKADQSVWWVAPVYGQAEVMFRRLRAQVSAKDLLTFNESKLIATLPTGAMIQFKSAEKPDNLYGDDVYAAVFDEFTRAREESWHALRSTLTSTGGKCKFIGNVKGKNNWGYRLAMKAKTGEDKNYHYFKITAYDAADAGMLTKDGRSFFEEIEDARRDLPEAVFNELYLAEPNEGGSNPFGLTHISRAVYPLSNAPAVCYGVDLAKRHDWTVIVGLDRFGHVCHFQRFQMDWKQTKEAILALPPGFITVDSTGAGDPIAEEIARARETEMFWFTSRSKQQLMEGLAYAIQNREVTILDGIMKDELESFEFNYSRTGVKYEAAQGSHDDVVCALALAVKNHKTHCLTGEISVW